MSKLSTPSRQSKVSEADKADAARLMTLWKASEDKPSQAAFGEQFDLGNQSNVGHYLHGRISLNPKAALAFANVLDCEVGDFSARVAQEIKQMKVSRTVDELTATPAPGEAAVRIPLLANAGSMGPGTESQQGDVIVGAITLSPEWLDKRIRPSSQRALGFIHAYGDSMSPTFEDGDILLVDTGMLDPSGADGVYVLEANHRVFIKRITEKLSGGHVVTSDNPSVKTADELNGDSEVQIKGKVVWVWNGRKL